MIFNLLFTYSILTFSFFGLESKKDKYIFICLLHGEISEIMLKIYWSYSKLEAVRDKEMKEPGMRVMFILDCLSLQNIDKAPSSNVTKVSFKVPDLFAYSPEIQF